MLNSLILVLPRTLRPQPETMQLSAVHTGVCLEVLISWDVA